jgi:hypothetical protein
MSLDISPEEFQRLAEQITRLAADYLSRLEGGPIQPAVSGKGLDALLGGRAPQRGCGAQVVELLRAIVDGSRVQNGRFLGYVMGSGEPVGAAADLLASVLNQNLTAWRSSPAGVTVERTVVRWLAEAIDCGGFSGHLTGGGSSANLMGLAMAREAKAPVNERGGATGVVYASEQAHMSIGKAVALLGLGRQSLRLLPTDGSFRMRPGDLDAAIARDRAAGLTPIAVVASAGTVATGAIDALADIAIIAEREGLWLHVDGAYGALAAMIAPEAFEGLPRADSISLDAHKWRTRPSTAGACSSRTPWRRGGRSPTPATTRGRSRRIRWKGSPSSRSPSSSRGASARSGCGPRSSTTAWRPSARRCSAISRTRARSASACAASPRSSCSRRSR